MHPKVSVICTVKNGEGFISQTIESILNQTLHNWEFIVVDDGSTDNTPKIIVEYSKFDERIKFISTKGVGRAKALNIAINNAKGEYIANIDADDPSHPMRLEIEAMLLDKYREYVLLAADSVIIKGNTSYNEINWNNEIMTKDIIIKDITCNLVKNNPISHSSVMIRREILLKVNGYNENIESNFDYELWVRLALKDYRLGMLPIKLSSKRIHRNQSFENKNRINYLKSTFRVQKGAIKKLNASKLYYIYLYLKFIYGLLPQSLRMTLRKFLSK